MIKFIDLERQQQRIKQRIMSRFETVLEHGQYIMGPEVHEFECQLQSFSGAPYALSCSNGTDALMLALMGLGVKSGDVILCPSFTFVATAEVIPSMGAIPMFVDVDPFTYNIDIESLKDGIAKAIALNLKPKGIIAVDLFGLPADYDAISEIANENEMWIISDAAQSFGSTYKNRKTGSVAEITTTSFFPAKPLGGYGDGGAVFCVNELMKEELESLRVHGMGTDRYVNIRIGMNGRLDTLQAAVLLEKLNIFDEELMLRATVSEFYTEHLRDIVQVPFEPDGYKSAWAQYTLRLPQNVDRSIFQAALKERGVPSMIYYPIPIHKQVAYCRFPRAKETLEVSESLSSSVVSLPFHPYLTIQELKSVVDAVKHGLYVAKV